jgi:hypothetical protein
LRLGNLIKRPIVITALVVIGLFVGFNYVGKALDKALNEPGGKPHTEMMLWKSPGYSKDPQLNFFKFGIYPDSNNIRVVYKIENSSDKIASIENAIDLEVVAGNPQTHNDPGESVWTWSKNRVDRQIETISVAPGGEFKEEINIERKQAQVGQQYYINAYYRKELVAQYKIIEGIYN